MDKSLIAAANDLGCDNRMAFLKVTLPATSLLIYNSR